MLVWQVLGGLVESGQRRTVSRVSEDDLGPVAGAVLQIDAGPDHPEQSVHSFEVPVGPRACLQNVANLSELRVERSCGAMGGQVRSAGGLVAHLVIPVGHPLARLGQPRGVKDRVPERRSAGVGLSGVRQQPAVGVAQSVLSVVTKPRTGVEVEVVLAQVHLSVRPHQGCGRRHRLV